MRRDDAKPPSAEWTRMLSHAVEERGGRDTQTRPPLSRPNAITTTRRLNDPPLARE